jgi:phosphate/sulfate permease
MKVTGWALIVIGAVIALFTVAYNLIDFNQTVEQVGTASGGTNERIWFALIPAAIAAGIGLWLLTSRHHGYRETYDMTRQQS